MSDVVVTFRCPVGDATAAYLAGDFNHWDVASHEMERRGEFFELDVTLRADTKTEYLFVVDGGRWEEDPMAPISEANPFGGRNSVMHVRAEPVAAEPAHDDAANDNGAADNGAASAPTSAD